MHFLWSPMIVPVVAMLIPIAAIVSGVWVAAQQHRNRAEQRMAMLARGVPIAEIERLIGREGDDEPRRVHDPLRSLGNARRAGIVLTSSGAGLIVFFIVLAIVLQVRPVLAGAAAGIIPIAIGIGFFIDYSMQKREMSRFGLELGADGTDISDMARR